MIVCICKQLVHLKSSLIKKLKIWFCAEKCKRIKEKRKSRNQLTIGEPLIRALIKQGSHRKGPNTQKLLSVVCMCQMSSLFLKKFTIFGIFQKFSFSLVIFSWFSDPSGQNGSSWHSGFRSHWNYSIIRWNVHKYK